MWVSEKGVGILSNRSEGLEVVENCLTRYTPTVFFSILLSNATGTHF